jgi:flagellar hook-length control protein FliK
VRRVQFLPGRPFVADPHRPRSACLMALKARICGRSIKWPAPCNDFAGAIRPIGFHIEGSGQVTSGVTVGFSPVQGSSALSNGVGGQKPVGDSPLGLFSALLALAGTNAIEGSQILPAPTAGQQTALDALLAALPGRSTAPATTAAAPDSAGEESEAAPDLATLLGNLLDALSAAVPATADAQPIAAPVEKKLDVAIEALAKALGIDLPVSGNTDAGESAANAPMPAALLDPLGTIAAAATTAPQAGSSNVVATHTAPAATPPTTTTSPAPATIVAPAATETAATDAATPKAIEAVPVPPAAVKLADRITALAKTIEPAAPALAEKLAALADRIKAGEIDAEALAKLGLPTEIDAPDAEIETAIARLLPPVRETRPAVAAAPFNAATLALPELGATGKVRATGSAEGRPKVALSHRPATDAPETKDDFQPPRNEHAAVREPGSTRPSPNAAPQAFAATDAAGAQGQASSAPPAHGLATATTVTADTRSVLAAYKAPAQQINIPQVAFEIVRQVQAGNSRFQIRIDPPELGRIDVKLDVDATGNVNARLTVERSETLDLMQRDSRALERALAQAGLDTSKTNLEFSLRQNPFGHDERAFQGNGQGNGNNPFAQLFGGNAEPDETPAVPAALAYRALASAGGVNIFV